MNFNSARDIPGGDSFFDIFLDLGECRYRVVVTSGGGSGNLTASVQVQNPSGHTEFIVDSFFDVFFDITVE